MKSEAMSQIVDLLTPLVLAILGYLSIKVTKYIDSKLKNQEDKDFAEKIRGLAMDSVKSVYQTYISKQKGQSTLEPEIAAKAKEMAMEQIKENLGAELTKKLGTDTSKIDSVLSTKVEAAVFDMKKITTPLLALVLCFPLLGCGVKPTSVAAATLDTQRNMVTTLDKGTALWYTFRQTECFNKGASAREFVYKNPEPTPEETELKANRTAYSTYDNCIAVPRQITDKIVQAVKLAKKENKIAAQTVLDVIRGKSTVAILGGIATPVVQLVLEIKKLIDDNGIVLTSYE